MIDHFCSQQLYRFFMVIEVTTLQLLKQLEQAQPWCAHDAHWADGPDLFSIHPYSAASSGRPGSSLDIRISLKRSQMKYIGFSNSYQTSVQQQQHRSRSPQKLSSSSRVLLRRKLLKLTYCSLTAIFQQNLLDNRIVRGPIHVDKCRTLTLYGIHKVFTDLHPVIKYLIMHVFTVK